MSERDLLIGHHHLDQISFILSWSLSNFDHDHLSPQDLKLEPMAMRKKVRRISETVILTVVIRSSPGFAYGCLGQWQDFYAVPHIVCPFPIMRSPHNHRNQHALSSQLEQPRIPNHKVWCNYRRGTEPCPLSW